MPENEQSQRIVPKSPFPKHSRAKGPGRLRARRCLAPLRGVEGRQKTGEARQGNGEDGGGAGYLRRARPRGSTPGAYLALGCPCAAGRPSRNLPWAVRRGYRVFLDLLEKRRTLLFSHSQKGHLFSQHRDTTSSPTQKGHLFSRRQDSTSPAPNPGTTIDAGSKKRENHLLLEFSGRANKPA